VNSEIQQNVVSVYILHLPPYKTFMWPSSAKLYNVLTSSCTVWIKQFHYQNILACHIFQLSMTFYFHLIFMYDKSVASGCSSVSLSQLLVQFICISICSLLSVCVDNLWKWSVIKSKVKVKMPPNAQWALQAPVQIVNYLSNT